MPIMNERKEKLRRQYHLQLHRKVKILNKQNKAETDPYIENKLMVAKGKEVRGLEFFF